MKSSLAQAPRYYQHQLWYLSAKKVNMFDIFLALINGETVCWMWDILKDISHRAFAWCREHVIKLLAGVYISKLLLEEGAECWLVLARLMGNSKLDGGGGGVGLIGKRQKFAVNLPTKWSEKEWYMVQKIFTWSKLILEEGAECWLVMARLMLTDGNWTIQIWTWGGVWVEGLTNKRKMAVTARIATSL